jgi:hypothetical protein
LALIATLLSIWLRISTALSEIIVIEAPTIVLAVGFDRDSNVRRPIFGVRS